MNAAHESIIAKFGSRLSMNFRPGTREIFLSPAGRFLDKPVPVNFGVLYNGVKYGLGFFDNNRVWTFGNDQTEFQFIEQHEEFDRVKFRCRDFRIGVDCIFEFIAPFYPQDKLLCTLPVLFVKATVNRLIDRAVRADDEKQISVYCDLMGSDFYELDGGLYQSDRYYLYDDYIHYQDTEGLRGFLDKNSFVKKGICGELYISCLNSSTVNGKTILSEGMISQTQELETCFAVSGYVGGDTLQAGGRAYQFYYTEKFKNIFEVADYAKENYRQIIEKSKSFNIHLEQSSLPDDYLSFLGFSFRSYAGNTWWAIDEGQKKEWFSVWEGNCLFHSTVDVEYNLGVFYLMLWPQLLEMQLENWNSYKKQGYISHDIGAVLNAEESAYPHDMEIEENCNFILLLYALCKTRGRKDIAAKYYKTAKELAEFNKSCDLTGNGLANTGVANTIDDSSDDVQFAEEQIYLGIKEYAAYYAMRQMSRDAADLETQILCEEECSKIKNTIEKSGWLGDHYRVNLISSNGKINPASIYKSMGSISTEHGSSAYSTYTANGFLYLFLGGEDVDWNLKRLKKDIVNAEKACDTSFGSTHSSVDKSHIWISQNIFRDLCAGYLGVDMSDNIQKYWAFEKYENQGGRGGCFIDTYGWNKLNYYPRGLASIGYLYSMAGLCIDEINKTIWLTPCKAPISIPLFHFADWLHNKVPVIHFYIENGEIGHRIENSELLSSYKIIV